MDYKKDIIISIHTPARGVTAYPQNILRKLVDFNPHSRKGSDRQAFIGSFRDYHFNPHSRKGSDNPLPIYGTLRQISIHTPARGVTSMTFSFYNSSLISIHTPARGVTIIFFEIAKFMYISIHTPARGVT